MYTLMRKRVLDNAYSYQTLPRSLQSTLHEKVPDSAYHATEADCSMPLAGLRSSTRKAP